MNDEQRKVAELLKAAGATFERKTGKGHEQWVLPNGMKFVRSNKHFAAKQQLADLKSPIVTARCASN